MSFSRLSSIFLNTLASLLEPTFIPKLMTLTFSFFRSRSVEEAKEEKTFVMTPLTKESKLRRHIRSMSDVQSSTPYRLPFRSRLGSTQTLMYDSDTRARRIRSYNRHLESSDSSDYDAPRKLSSLERNILKHTDSMRVL